MIEDPTGSWDMVDKVYFDKNVLKYFPLACDRYYEARFHARQGLILPPSSVNIGKVNWYFNAHLVAINSLEEAAISDFKNMKKGKLFNNSPIAKEYLLESEGVPSYDRDPYAYNRAYIDLRNLNVHFSIKNIIISNNLLTRDIKIINGQPIEHRKDRWFINPIRINKHRQLRDPKLSEIELKRINEVFRARPASSVTGLHLNILWRVLVKSCNWIAG